MPLSSAHPRDLPAFARARLVPRDELRRASPTHVTYSPSLARVSSHAASYGGQARPTRPNGQRDRQGPTYATDPTILI